jgi:hypothetical protein
MAVIAAVEFALWWAMSNAGFARAPTVALYNIVEVIGVAAASIPFFLWYLLKVYREGEARPTRRIARDFDPARAVAVVLAMLLGSVMGGAFSALKAAIPLAVPFYLDGWLASFERAIFGTDPWRISHALFGWATPAIDLFYWSWLPVMVLAFNLVLLSAPSPIKARSLITYMLLWPIIGTLGGYMLSSAGPIFHDDLFGGHLGLVAALRAEGATGNLHAHDYLWNAYVNRHNVLGGGISAMPSMHVAMACWLALTVRASIPRFQWLGWTYLVLIWASSVHLGWHYASDGFAGITGAFLIWRAVGSWTWRSKGHPLAQVAAGAL